MTTLIEPLAAPSGGARAGASLSLLGGWRLEIGARTVEVPRSIQRVIAFVALTGRPQRELAAARLWPGCPRSRAEYNLRSALWRIHRLRPGLVTETAGRLALWSGLQVDIDAPSGSADDVLLPGWYDDWVVVERERLGHRPALPAAA
jgi:hypothetical protein